MQVLLGFASTAGHPKAPKRNPEQPAPTNFGHMGKFTWNKSRVAGASKRLFGFATVDRSTRPLLEVEEAVLLESLQRHPLNRLDEDPTQVRSRGPTSA